jgi:ribosomal protein S18 acetylase RimI-like enzyme
MPVGLLLADITTVNPLPSVRRFDIREWRAYRDIRLRALGDSPNAFSSTLDLEQSRSDDDWAKRLAAGATSRWNLPLVAEHENELVGLAWGRINPAEPETAYIFQMWVAPRCRELGLGAMLLDALLNWAREAGAQIVKLGVTCGDSPARRLYAQAGFVPAGDPEPLRPGADVLAQPMRLELRRGAASPKG